MKQLKTNIAASIRDIASIWKGFSLPRTPPTDIITAAAANPPLSILKYIQSLKNSKNLAFLYSDAVEWPVVLFTYETLRGTCKERLLHHRCALYPHALLVRSQVS